MITTYSQLAKEDPMTTQKQKCEQFASLHQQDGVFVIPNPWDAGSAKLLQGLGYKALATTSAGFAYTLGRSDGEVSLEEKLAHCAQLASATSIPINADFENAFSDSAQRGAENILQLVATGVAGCSIEDYSRDSKTIYDFNQAVDKVQAAAEALQSVDMPFQLTARAENLLRGVNDLDDTIRRLKAYEAAGANVLYAPGLTTLDQLKQVTQELSKPFNVLSVFFTGVTVAEFAEAGAKRISLGGALNWAAINPLISAGKEMLEQGSFDWTKTMASSKEVNELLA